MKFTTLFSTSLIVLFFAAVAKASEDNDNALIASDPSSTRVRGHRNLLPIRSGKISKSPQYRCGPKIRNRFVSIESAHGSFLTGTVYDEVYQGDRSMNFGAYWMVEDSGGCGDDSKIFFLKNSLYHHCLSSLTSESPDVRLVDPNKDMVMRWAIKDAGGGKVAIQSEWNSKYLRADYDNSDVVDYATTVGDWERWIIREWGYSNARIKSKHGTFLGVSDDTEHDVRQVDGEIHHPKWDLEPVGWDTEGRNIVFIKNVDNTKYLSARSEDEVTVVSNRENQEKWIIKDTEGGKVTIQSEWNFKYLRADDDNSDNVDYATTVGDWERWDIGH